MLQPEILEKEQVIEPLQSYNRDLVTENWQLKTELLIQLCHLNTD